MKSAWWKRTDELRLLKNVTVTNTLNEADFETVEVDTEDTLEPDKNDKDEDYVPEIKKGKYDMFSKYVGGNSDSIPEEFQYVRYGDRSVRPELYSVMYKLSSKYHMSKSQIEGSIITIANTLFGREWRPYTPREERDLNTLPSMKNLVHTEPYFEAITLSSIVEEVMSEDTIASITYSNDGSSVSEVGSYVVQSLTLNGVQRCLPSFGIFTESRESLKDLEICTVKILSASCCHEYSEKEILQHIKFVMTDST